MKKASSVVIQNKPTHPLLASSTYQLNVAVTPPDANSTVRYTSTKPAIADVLDNGLIVIGSIAGNTTIKASIDNVEDTFLLTVAEMVHVSSISGIPRSIESGTIITLNPVISPTNATYQEIVWSVVNANTNIVSITDKNKLKVEGSGKVVIRATITGDNEYKYTQDFELDVTAPFVKVTDVAFDLTYLYTGIPGTLGRTVSPSNATNTSTTYEIISGTGRIVNNTIISDTPGNIKIRVRIKDGKSVGDDFTKDFTVEVRKSTPSVVNISSPTSRITTSNVSIPIVITGDATDLTQYDVTVTVTPNIGTATFDYGRNEIKLSITDTPVVTTPLNIQIRIHDKNGIYSDKSFAIPIEFHINNTQIDDINIEALQLYTDEHLADNEVFRVGNTNIIKPLIYPADANYSSIRLIPDGTNITNIIDNGDGTWKIDPDTLNPSGNKVIFTIDAVISRGGNEIVLKSKRFDITVGPALADITTYQRKSPITTLEINTQYDVNSIVEYEPTLDIKALYRIFPIQNDEGLRVVKLTDGSTTSYVSATTPGYGYLVLGRELSTKYPVKLNGTKNDFQPIQVLKVEFHDPNRVMPGNLNFIESEIASRTEGTSFILNTSMNIESTGGDAIVYDDWNIDNITSSIPGAATYDSELHKLNIVFNASPGTSGSTVPLTVTMVLKDKRKVDNDITLTKIVNMKIS